MSQSEKICWVVDLGLTPYEPACELQHRLVEARKSQAIPDMLLFCEHPHVITMGRNSRPEHLLGDNRLLEQKQVELHSSDRGGDVTYHGPGQIVGYPILDLAEHRRDIRWYVEQLEEIMIRTTEDFGIPARRVEGQHGAWVDGSAKEEKLGALGVHLSRWVTSHGFAYNVSTDLRYFDLIVPCGLAGKGVTSLEHLLHRPIAIERVRESLASHFASVFNRQLQPITPTQLADSLGSRHITPDVLMPIASL